jgi:hypothetical protein
MSAHISRINAQLSFPEIPEREFDDEYREHDGNDQRAKHPDQEPAQTRVCGRFFLFALIIRHRVDTLR